MLRSILGRAAALSVAALAAVSVLTPTSAAPAQAAASTVLGADISWPECPKGMGIPTRRTEGNPMPGPSTKFVIVGMSNGPAFNPNPCLANQVKWIKAKHVYAAPYAVVTYPTALQLKKYGKAGPYKGTSVETQMRNVGWAQAKYNLANLRAAGMTAPMVWMDVEHYPVRPWSKNRTYNRAVVSGVLAGYRHAGMKVGVYSTMYQWADIVGTNARWGLPEWRTAGQTSLTKAKSMCTKANIQGGRAVVAQWWNPRSDFDVMCPGYQTSTVMKQYFHKY